MFKLQFGVAAICLSCLSDKAFSPMGHFLDCWGFRIISLWNNGQFPFEGNTHSHRVIPDFAPHSFLLSTSSAMVPCLQPCQSTVPSLYFLLQHVIKSQYPVGTVSEPLLPHSSVNITRPLPFSQGQQQTDGQSIIETAPGRWRFTLCFSAMIDSYIESKVIKKSPIGTGEVILHFCAWFMHFCMKSSSVCNYWF